MACLRPSARFRRQRALSAALALFAVAASLSLDASLARSQEPTVSVRVDYRGGPACTDGSEFTRELLTRDPRVRLSRPGERAPRVLVTVQRGARAGVHGQLVVEDLDGTSSRRDVDGDSCPSILRALALMAAIAVDPTGPFLTQEPAASGLSTPAPGPGGASEQRAPEELAPTSPQAAASSTTSRSAEDAGPSAATATPEPERPETSGQRDGPESRSGLHLALTGSGGATTGTAPSVAWLFAPGVELGVGRYTAFAPVLRAGFTHADSGDDSATGGSARFVLNAATLDVCASFPLARRLTVLPCLRAEAGAMSAAGADISPPRADTRPWIGVGGLGAVRYVAAGPFFVELSFGARIPLVRDHFYFEPDVTVFQPPPVAGFVSGSLGLIIL